MAVLRFHSDVLQLARGLYAVPARSRFGKVPPTDEAVMRSFLDGSPFVFTGPEKWNALGLGSTAMLADTLVYNTKRSGVFKLGGRLYVLRRVAFPQNPPPEWYLVDLFEHADQVGVSRTDMAGRLGLVLADGQFDGQCLLAMARRYGTKNTQSYIGAALRSAAS